MITYYVYDGEKAILEYNNVYQLVAKNIYGKAIDEILMRTDYTVTPNVTYYYQDDHEGSVTHLTNDSGAVIESYRYDAFGAPTVFNSTSQPINASTVGNRFMFTGREYAQKFGVYEYRNRAYHPTLGRFTSEDPMGFAAGDDNLFRYCGNDPIDKTDPMGLATMERILKDFTWEMAKFFDSSNSSTLTFAQVMAGNDSKSVDEITKNQLQKQLVDTKGDKTTTVVPTEKGPQVTEPGTEVKTMKGGSHIGTFGYRGAEEKFKFRSDALTIPHAHTTEGPEAALPSKDRDYAAVQQAGGAPMYFTSRYLARHGADPFGKAGNYIILHYTGPRRVDEPRPEYGFDPRFTLPLKP